MGNLLPVGDIEDLRAAIAAGRDKSAIMAEAHAAHHARVRQIVDQLDVQPPLNARVEHSMPVLALALQVRWKLLGHQLRERVSNHLKLCVGVLEIGSDLRIRHRRRRRWTCHSRGARIGIGLALLRRGGACQTTRTAQSRLVGAR